MEQRKGMHCKPDGGEDFKQSRVKELVASSISRLDSLASLLAIER